MKKILLSLMISATGFFAAQSQTIVTTSPMDKNVILEEYTGIHCQYCPQGHAIAQSIQNNNPGRVVLVNIHQGSFANPSAGEPDFRTPFGDALANQTGLTGYPSGTVNRHVFSGSNTALSRGDWTASANIIMAQPSPVNVGIESSFNSATRELTVNVELYYTANSAVPTNYINVALIQDHVFGPQTGGSPPNNYEHMHMLRYFLTGQWGDVVNTTTQGTLVERTYTYTVPADYNNVPCVVENCQVAVYVAESHQEILSGDVVDAIGGTNLYIGDFSTSDSTLQLGHPTETTTIDLEANSNIAGSEPFIIKLVHNAPADWDAGFMVDGQTYTDSVVTNLVKGTPTPVSLNVIPGETAGFYPFTFSLKSVNNPAAPVKYFTVYLLSNTNTLLVNAAGDENAGLHQDVYINGLVEAGSEKNAVMNSTMFVRAFNSDILTDVLNVFYNIAWTFPAFTDPEAIAVMDFVDEGGKLLVAGQDIGWDIMSMASGSHNTPETEDLYTNYLKADYIDDGSSANNKFIANTDDPIYGTVVTSNVVDVNAGNMYPDQIAPLDNATATFYYNTTKTKTGAVKSTMGTAKVAYFGIGLEMIQTEAVRNDIIKKTWNWFMEGVGMEEQNKQEYITLNQNVPNPCTLETTINFEIPAKDKVVMRLYDISGKEIAALLNAELNAGTHEVTLATGQFNAGIYYYTLQTSHGKQTRKMVVVK